jgi:SAM-dependent methyltransferase
MGAGKNGAHMKSVVRVFERSALRARQRRADLFRKAFPLTAETTILDLGSESGGHIHSVLQGTPVAPHNVYIADIRLDAIARGAKQYGFQPVPLGEDGKLPFPDGFFDIVYCSSVIEHVTLPKNEVWAKMPTRVFRERSLAHQREFAREIQRVGRQFFVQTPYRWFVIEAHSFMPFLGWLPREAVIPILKYSRKFWPKWCAPDWHLLDRKQLASMFDGAEIRDEKWCGLTKSIMAVKVAREERAPVKANVASANVPSAHVEPLRAGAPLPN